MQNDVKQNLQSEVLITCLDVLCRANATVVENDPKPAADIILAIKALSTALRGEEFLAPGTEAPCKPSGGLPILLITAEKNVPDHAPVSETIVDVLTNEVIRKPSLGSKTTAAL